MDLDRSTVLLPLLVFGVVLRRGNQLREGGAEAAMRNGAEDALVDGLLGYRSGGSPRRGWGEEEMKGRENRANAQTKPCENVGFVHTTRGELMRNEIAFVNVITN